MEVEVEQTNMLFVVLEDGEAKKLNCLLFVNRMTWMGKNIFKRSSRRAEKSYEREASLGTYRYEILMSFAMLEDEQLKRKMRM